MDKDNIKNKYCSTTKKKLRSIRLSLFLLLPMVSFFLFVIGALYSEVVPIKIIPIISGVVVMSTGLLFFSKLLLDMSRLYKSTKSMSDIYNNKQDVILSANKKDILGLQKTCNLKVLIYVQLFFILIIGAFTFLEAFYLVNDYVRLGFPQTRLLIAIGALVINILLFGSTMVKRQVYNENKGLYSQVKKVWLGLKVFIVFGILYVIHLLILVSSGVT